MALPSLAVIDGNGDPQTISTLRSARAAAADSSGVALSTEDLAAINAITAAVADVETAIGGITGSSSAGDVAHDAADSGNPVKIGTKAIAALSGATLVAAADRSNAYSDLDGAILVRADGALGDFVSGTNNNADGTSTQVIAAAGAGVKTYITDITLANTSSSNIIVELKDGSTVKWTFPVPANGGVTHHFRSPLAGTANTAWNFDPSAATTTVYCSAAGFKSKV
jgi:hypothetical protein